MPQEARSLPELVIQPPSSAAQGPSQFQEDVSRMSVENRRERSSSQAERVEDLLLDGQQDGKGSRSSREGSVSGRGSSLLTEEPLDENMEALTIEVRRVPVPFASCAFGQATDCHVSCFAES